ncbi:DUF1353 domain-containing protein [Janibacter sp. DB-40]|uniref:DUF1353 domain-containing protein n=1 Tax=Janibacter sp. DB-40 TaxID=3028808 RepID=UPI002404D65F|nr:DUF1353 domain-containing protein [Janibacter sp. DB-40]
MTHQLAPQVRRFYDGGTLEEAPDPSAPPVVALERTAEMEEPDDFRMVRRIAYLDRELGELLVPADPSTFTTDLASVPSVFAWLIPRSGHHLPAALLHDGLVSWPPEPPAYLSTRGIEVDVEEANRVFRDAMADTGAGLVRRWLMWTAVTLAVMVRGDRTWSRAQTWRWRVASVGSLVVLTVLGLWTTADLVDLDLPLVGGVPWMGEGALGMRLATGAAGAIAIPLVLAQLWGRFRTAGMIAGTALALLLHVTLAVAALTGLYRALEWLCARAPTVALALAAVMAVAALVVFVGAL